MSTLGTVVIVMDILAVLTILYFILPRPWPMPYERPFICDQCWRSYRDATSLAWHRTGQHPALFEDDHDHH